MTRQLGGFDRALRFAMDYDLVLKLGAAGNVRHVRYVVGAFRMHPASKTTNLERICREETEQIRKRLSHGTRRKIRLLHFIGKLDVLLRMCREGCLGCRIGTERYPLDSVLAQGPMRPL
jgi:hypothetical protein